MNSIDSLLIFENQASKCMINYSQWNFLSFSRLTQFIRSILWLTLLWGGAGAGFSQELEDGSTVGVSANITANSKSVAPEVAGISESSAIETETIVDPTQHPSYLEFQRIMARDDSAQLVVSELLKNAETFANAGADVSQQAINDQIFKEIQPVRELYESFLKRYPNHVGAHLALGSFLSDFGEEIEGMEHWEKARELDPSNPAAWNNLAGFYGHFGPIRKSLEFYEKAIELAPDESIYWSNLATMTQLFRKDALDYYQLEDDQAVIRKSLEFYKKAWAMNDQDFPLATDLAQTYYFLEPFDFKAAEEAWKKAMLLAGDDIEREGIHIHQARIHILDKNWEEARSYLSRIQHSMYQNLKSTLEKRLEREKKQSEDAEAESLKNQSP